MRLMKGLSSLITSFLSKKTYFLDSLGYWVALTNNLNNRAFTNLNESR